MKQSTVEMIQKWHERGYSVEETARLLKRPEVEVKSIVNEYEKHKRA